ncbi:MAG TPA: ATP synthase F1 subunit epsilon [Capsulimonadaceae bacterium]
MANTYTLEVVTPERVLLSAEVVETIAPGSEGYLGILAGHMALMTALNPGEVRVKFADGRTTSQIVISGGFLEVARAKTTILADSAERVDEINVNEAEADLAEARRLLAELEPGTTEFRAAARKSQLCEARVRSVKG